MAKAMQINILSASDDDSIEKVIEEIKSLKNASESPMNSLWHSLRPQAWKI